LGRKGSEKATPRRSRSGGGVRPSPVSSGELGPARLGFKTSPEVEEGETGSGRGNAGAAKARRHGAERRRRWTRRQSRGGGVSACEGWLHGLYRCGGDCRGGFVSPGRQCAAGGGQNQAAGEVAALAGGGVSWRRFPASRTRVRTGRSQGAGQVALAGSLGSTWPWTHRGRGPPAAYGRAAAEQRGERNQGRFCDFQKFRDLSIN